MLCFLSNVVARIRSVLPEKLRDFRRWGAAGTLAPQLIRLCLKIIYNSLFCIVSNFDFISPSKFVLHFTLSQVPVSFKIVQYLQS